MRNTVIASTGRYLPAREVRNADLDWFPATAIEKVSQKTGVLSRRNAAPDECTSDLACRAAQACLERVKVAPEDIEGIIVSTSSPDRMQPATAVRVQHLLGARRAFAFDINSVCSGSVYGINLADSLIKSGNHERILFIAAELYTKILNKKDFSTFPYFGDGAGAILFEPGDQERGVVRSVLHTDGGGSEIITVPSGGTMLPFEQITNPRSACFRMDGRTVFEFATRRGPEVIREVLADAGIPPQEISLFISHQANINILHQIADQLDVPHDRFFVNLDRYGNTASASVLIALDEALSAGRVKAGDLVVTVAFGGGLSWGANLIRI